MSPKESAEILQEFNDWRRGRGKYAWTGEPREFLVCPYCPAEIGEAIDAAVTYIRKKQDEEDDEQRL